VPARSFNVVYEDLGDGWVSARVPELPEVRTQGKSREQARKMVRHAIALALEERHARDQEIPSMGRVLVEPIEVDEDAAPGHEPATGDAAQPEPDPEKRRRRHIEPVTDVWGTPLAEKRRRRDR
jgi:predicted RNase H-like HicB family nuclease